MEQTLTDAPASETNPGPSPRSERGHANNSANLSTLVTILTAMGAVYNPVRVNLKLPALQALDTQVKNSLAQTATAEANYKNAIVARQLAFNALNTTATRSLNALKATETSAQVDQNAVALIRKIRGTRVSTKLTAEQKAAAGSDAPKEISSAQTGFDNRIDFFDRYIKLLTTIPLYAPNENDLKLTALNAILTDLRAKHTAVISAEVALNNARITRNDLLYKPLTGVTDIAADVKTYVKSVFGANSPNYKMTTKLKFSRPN